MSKDCSLVNQTHRAGRYATAAAGLSRPPRRTAREAPQRQLVQGYNCPHCTSGVRGAQPPPRARQTARLVQGYNQARRTEVTQTATNCEIANEAAISQTSPGGAASQRQETPAAVRSRMLCRAPPPLCKASVLADCPRQQPRSSQARVGSGQCQHAVQAAARTLDQEQVQPTTNRSRPHTGSRSVA